MNGFDEIGIARESLQGDRLIPPEESGDVVLLHIPIGELEPRQRVFEAAPDPLNRVQLGTVGGRNTSRTLAGSMRLNYTVCGAPQPSPLD
jgi:hypothetical protein